MNKRQEYLYKAYLHSNEYGLGDAYGSYSTEKRDAWDYCRALMFKKGGHTLKIISHNGYMFTAGFLFDDDKKMMYITKSRNEEFEVAK